MTKPKSWEQFFDKHAAVYDENGFTSNTLFEVDFLIKELKVSPGVSILDVGCGTGRHSVELAKRGYNMTGVDLSSGMLSKAQEKAETAGVNVTWIQADAAQFTFDEKFNAAFCLCEGAFGLLSNDDDGTEQASAILSNVSKVLKPNAITVFTMLNAFAMIRKYNQDDVEKGRFDPLVLTESSEHSPVEGAAPILVRERGFVPTEAALLFERAGLQVLNIWGGTAGSWNRQKIRLDEIEIMVIAQKKA
ncbi:class I SAM-dependent methyltransferase [bacterium]|nr:class I SAM-dependent methyltransferase [bacterium]